MIKFISIFIYFSLLSGLWAQSDDDAYYYPTPSSEALKIGCAVVGGFIGFVVGGNLTGEIVIAIQGHDKNQISQIGGGAIGFLGVLLGLKIAELLSNTDAEEDQAFAPTLQISPIYDLAQNGMGLGVSLSF